MPAPILLADGLEVGYRGSGWRGRSFNPVVSVVRLEVRAGDVVVVLGANGAGKTTLLRALTAVTKPHRGTVFLSGHPIRGLDRAERARQLAMVSAERVDPGLLRVEEVVALGRYPFTGARGTLRASDRAVVERVIGLTGAAHLAGRRVAQLSDGERQRVMIARALAQEPAILVLDEPTAFLDIGGRVMIHTLVQRLAKEHGLAVVMATHDVELALEIATVVWLIVAGTVTVGPVADLRPQIDAAFGTAGRLLAGTPPVS